MFTCSHKPNDLLRALRAGADGYVTKDAEPARLLREIAAVAHGETPISPNMLGALVREFQRLNVVRRHRASAVRERLTPREFEILTMIADGKSTGAIALELVISIETVRSHVKAVLRKLGVHSRAAAIARLEELRDDDAFPRAA
jgi:two-component system nitrate/nitrite response regulator NarL